MESKKLKLAVASGKGGVGKSMLASSLALLFSRQNTVVAVDCDVDAPNLHLWLGEDESWEGIKKLSLTEKAEIDLEKCIGCGKCADICAFNAIEMVDDKPVLNRFLCEGCGACAAVCPGGAVTMVPVENAEIRVRNTRHGFPLVSAQIYPGESGSGKVVDEIKKRAEEFSYEVMVLDSPAGTGCPVIASLNGVDLVVLVTEPTPSGFSDLRRVLQVVGHFKIPYGVVINKWDINKDLSGEIEEEFGGQLFGKISYDKEILQAVSSLQPVVKTSLPAKKEIEALFDRLRAGLTSGRRSC
jgi:MinD superfamily P-loop ATPase